LQIMPAQGPELIYQNTSVSLEGIPGALEPAYDPLSLYTQHGELYGYRDPERRKEYYVYGWRIPIYGEEMAEGLTVGSPKFRPNVRRQRVLGVRNDWNVEDKKDPRSIWLQKMHREIFDPDWTAWNAYSRLPFMNALDALSEEQYNDRLQARVDRFVDAEYAKTNPAEYLLASTSAVMWFWETMRFGSATNLGWDRQRPIHDWLATREPAINPTDLYSRFRNRPSGKQLLEEMPDRLRGDMVDRFLESRSYIPIDTTQTAQRIYQSPNWVHRELSVYPAGDNKVSLDFQGGWALVEFDNGEPKIIGNDWSNFKYRAPDLGLKPKLVIEYDLNSGEYNYLYDKLPVSNADLNSEARARLGLVMAAYLSDEQRDSFPRRARVEYQGKIYRQTIDAAQTVLFWPQHTKKLAKGVLPRAIRDFVNNDPLGKSY
jgi:hypothetical protein